MPKSPSIARTTRKPKPQPEAIGKVRPAAKARARAGDAPPALAPEPGRAEPAVQTTGRPAYEPAAGDRQFTANLARGLEVLRAFTPADLMLGNSELCQRTGLPKATISRLTYTLTQLGYLVRIDRLQKYQLGAELLSLSYPLLAGLDVRHIARPHMESLARATGCTVNLGMLGRLEVVYIDALRLDRGNLLRPDIGSTRPLLTTSIGRALLLASAEPERVAVLNRLRVANPDRFAAEIGSLHADQARFRMHGFCLSEGDLSSSIHAVAAPLRTGARDHRLLALNCTSTTFAGKGGQRRGSMEQKVAPHLLQAVRDIEHAYEMIFRTHRKY